MSLITSTEIRDIVNPDVSFDPAYFELNISYSEEVIKGILTIDLYNDVVANPLTYTDLIDDYIKNALAYVVAFNSYEKDLERSTANQGIMENNTQYSKSADHDSARRTLAKIKDLEYFYCKKLGDYLLDNYQDFPLFDIDAITYEPNLRRFFPI